MILFKADRISEDGFEELSLYKSISEKCCNIFVKKSGITHSLQVDFADLIEVVENVRIGEEEEVIKRLAKTGFIFQDRTSK